MSSKQFQDDLAEWELHSGGGLSNDVEAWLERYIADKNTQGVSPKTVKSYREAISPFIEFCHGYEDVMDIEDMTAKFVNNYLMWYQEKLAQNDFVFKHLPIEDYEKVMSNKSAKRGKNDATLITIYKYEKSLSHRLTILKQLLFFIAENNKEQKDFTVLFKHFTKIKVQKRHTDYLTAKEMEELIAFMRQWPYMHKEYKPKSSSASAWRDATIVLLYCLTGARSDEVLSLKMEHIQDISLEDDEGKVHPFYSIQYHTTKGDKYREVVIHKNDIESFIVHMRGALIDHSFVLSSTTKSGKATNKKMNDSEMYRFVTWALHMMGIKKSGRHIIRRGYATKEIADGKELAVVALDLGHSSTNTTFNSYVKNNPELMMKQKLKNAKVR